MKKSIALIGYGIEGKSTQQYFQKNFPKTEIQIFDDHLCVEAKNILSLQNLNIISASSGINFSQIFVSPGISRSKIPNSFHAIYTSQIEYFFQNIPEYLRKRVIGITGSKGKSTTTKFTAELLQNAGYKVAIAGNFGQPFLDVLDDFLEEKYDFIIAEISSYQSEYLQISPGICIFLSFFSDHLDRHGKIDNYFAAKANCFLHQKSGDSLIVSPEVYKKLDQTTKFRASLPEGETEREVEKKSAFPPYIYQNFQCALKALEIISQKNYVGVPLMGAQNGQIQDLALQEIYQKTLQNFQGLPHRMQEVGEWKNLKIYDNVIAVSPEATLNDVRFFGKNLQYLILGGQNTGNDFIGFFEKIAEHAPYCEILILEDSEMGKIWQKQLTENKHANNAFPSGGCWERVKNKISYHKNFPQIFQHIKNNYDKTPPHMEGGKKGDVEEGILLLSPAAKSYDQFKNFAEKGESFQKAFKNTLK